MQVEIQLVGKPNRWVYKQRRIRIGRDSSCDVSLPGNEYPMVSREHLVLEIEGDGIALSDPRSGNGTFLNGKRVNTGSLRSGDILRLGADGPELQISITDTSAQTVLASAADTASTRISGGASTQLSSSASSGDTGATLVADRAAASTIVENAPTSVGPTATMIASECLASTRIAQPSESSPTALAGQEPQPQTASSSRPVQVAFRNTAKEPIPETKPATPQSAAKNTQDIGDEQVIERKLNSIRTLLAANLAIMIVLLFALFYMNQQIEKNRKDLGDMRIQAQTAVGQFTPALDSRLNTFEKRLDGVDVKMKDAEDHLVVRMNNEIPAMLDKYVDQKVEQAKRQAATARP